MRLTKYAIIPGLWLSLLTATSCSGILSDIYDEPPTDEDLGQTTAGSLYLDASDWTKWYYIDLPALKSASDANPSFNPSSAWVAKDIPTQAVATPVGNAGIYTYWFDVFGQGISVREFRSYTPTAVQEDPASWTLAIHRNNARTNGCAVAQTEFTSVDDPRITASYVASLSFEADSWNESDVWVIQDRMLQGIIGCQGIEINPTLSSWLDIRIPPMPPAFSLNNRVFIVRLPDGEHAALQLENYKSPTGTNCCMTINYRYPLELK